MFYPTEDADLKAAIKRNIAARYANNGVVPGGLTTTQVEDVVKSSLNDIKFKLNPDPIAAQALRAGRRRDG